jgi:putative colanic acid biosysnthesis UDP-glucose lipid carrier transferase
MNKIARALNAAGLSDAVQPVGLGEKLKRPRLLSRKMLAEMMVAFDFISIFSAGFAARYLYVVLQEGKQLDLLNCVSIMSLVALGFHFVGRQNGLYDTAKLTDFSEQLSGVLYVWVSTSALLFATLFFLKLSDQVSRLWCMEWLTILLLLLAFARGITIRYFQRMDRAGVLRRFVVLIGFGDQFSALRARILGDNRNYSLCAVVELPAVPRSAPEQMELEEVHKLVARYTQSAHEFEADDIMIALPPGHGSLTNLILREVQKVSADIHIVPDLGEMGFTGIRMGQLGKVTYLTTMSKPIAGWGAFFKKAEDYILASIGLFLLAPALACIALAIKLDSKGPVFFRQRRHGYNHQVIEVLKFRSMTTQDNGDNVVQAKRNDPRVTRVGRILRRTSLDELPQLINVLKGEMSIVGPRPHALAHNTYYGDLVENYANRHRVKPGITGWAQVHGFRGETDNPEMMAQRIRYDLEYIDNWSLWLDVKIIFMTPLFGLFVKGAY